MQSNRSRGGSCSRLSVGKSSAKRYQGPALILIALMALAAGSGSRAHEPGQDDAVARVKARYTKSEYQIAMRDGVKLFTSVYVPKDTSRQYPIMMLRTPYSVAPYGPDDYRDN